MSCTRPFQLRRQHSAACEPGHRQQSTSKDPRRARLQKQLSADPSAYLRDVGGPTGQSRRARPASGDGDWSETVPETSLRIFTAFKNKNNMIRCNEANIKSENVLRQQENHALSIRSHKQNDEKININIFLAQRISDTDVGSDSEGNAKATKPPTENHCATTTNPSQPNTADARRTLFRRKSASLSEIRPRLTRAMSAPLHSMPSNEPGKKPVSSNINAGSHSSTKQKRMRRKKIAPIDLDAINLRIATNQSHSISVIDRPLTAVASNERPFGMRCESKPPRAAVVPPAKAKAAMNVSDIVTLVSLLSPGASDSEKEDVSANGEVPNERQKPSLRKVGKSVSFQDDDGGGDDDPLIDLPSVLRRASLAPLASRIRLNRPPTAPPGSIFHKSNATNLIGMNTDSTAQPSESNKAPASDRKMPVLPLGDGQISKTPIEILSTSCALRKSSLNLADPSLTFPEYVRSIKEKECWLLFQKMVNKGISVTYETILRGVLTPSEFRAVERKQREIVERLSDEASVADESHK